MPDPKRPAPPVYRPKQNGPVTSTAPPVYRPQVAQAKPSPIIPPPPPRPVQPKSPIVARAPVTRPPTLSPASPHQGRPTPFSIGRPVGTTKPLYRPVNVNGAIQRSCCDGVLSWLGSCFRPNPAPYEELELEDSQLADWGAATLLGYHKTAHWNEIRRTGEFKPGGGKFGPGWYLVGSDGKWVTSMYPALKVWLEVGYVGDMSRWVEHTPESMLGYQDSNDYDIIKTSHQEGAYNQIVYKPNGPSNITMQNFRVRRTNRSMN